MSALPFQTNSSWATDSTTPSATAIWPMSASCLGSKAVLSSQPSVLSTRYQVFDANSTAAIIEKPMGAVLIKHEKHLQVEPLLLEVADVMATSLDLDTTLRRVAEVVRKVIDYEIFAILLLNEKTQELRIRFQVGYPPEFAERARIKVGAGVTGQAAQLRQTILIDDVTKDPRYIEAVPNVRSELAVPLIYKNRVG